MVLLGFLRALWAHQGAKELKLFTPGAVQRLLAAFQA